MASDQQVGNIVYQVQMDVAELIEAQKKVNDRLEQMNGKFNQSSQSAGRFEGALNKVGVAIAAAFTVETAKRLLAISDEMNILQARITRLSPSVEAAKETMSSLADIASKTGASLSDTEKLWESLTASLKEAGATNDQVLNLTDTLQKIGRIGGSSTEEMANALRQFGQSIASGTIRAEEFNSILEQMPELARQIATGLGISMGQLRQEMLAGKLTAQDALNAIQDRTGAVNEEFSKLPRTMSQATGSLETSFAKLVASINNATGASSAIVSAIDLVARSIDTLASSSSTGADKILAMARVLAIFNPTLAEAVENFDKLNKSNAAIDAANVLAADMKAVTKETNNAADATKHFTIAAGQSSGAQKSASAAAKKAATEQQNVAQKLANLKQQSELAADSTNNLSREQAILNAQLSLGKGATQEQIALAGKYAAAKWDTANALKAQAAAEKLLPESRENASYKQDVQDLNTALAAKKISQEQYNETSERLEQTHMAALAKIRADQAVTPVQEAAGAVDPVQALANQHAKQIALIQQYEQQGVLTHQNALAQRNAADTLYEQQRINAQWEIWKNQDISNQMLAASFESLAGNASNAFTGIITGSMSAQEAMQSLASNALNSLINGFVQMGVEWVKSAITGSAAQISATAATTSASVAGIATTTAASTASAATTTTSWLPAAAAASIGSFGGAAVIGIGALVAGMALANGLAGKRKNGGPVSAGSMYQVGEGGMPEIYQASNGSQYMIPGDNGSVISNKDMQSGGGQMAVNIVFNDYSSSQHSFDAQASQDGNTLTVQAFIQDMDQGGPMRQSITRNTSATPRATE